jgi:hypothetical protein
MLCFPYYAYVFSSTNLEIEAEQVLPGSEEGGVHYYYSMYAHVNK